MKHTIYPTESTKFEPQLELQMIRDAIFNLQEYCELMKKVAERMPFFLKALRARGTAKRR